MNRPAIDSPESYIKKELARESEFVEKDIDKSFFEQVVDYDFAERGVLDVRINNLHLKLSYEPIVIPKRMDAREGQRRVARGEILSADEICSYFLQCFEQFADPAIYMREVTNLVLETNDSYWEFGELAPKGRLFVSTFHGRTPVTDIFDDTNNRIYIMKSNILTRDGLLCAMHECGHMVTMPKLLGSENLKKSAKKMSLWAADVNSPPALKDSALAIEMEREAWAYAFKTIKPFMKDLGMSATDIVKVKNIGLNSYHSGVLLASVLNGEYKKLQGVASVKLNDQK